MNDTYMHAPHRRSGAEELSTNAALLIDFDNVTMGTRSNLGQELRRLLNSDIIKGKVAVQRAYADWRRYPQYIVSLSESSIDLIFAPAYGSSKKNATDIRLAIDALELVFTRPEIGTFILLSGDSDFSSLVLKLKEYGKYVIGVGMQESSSDLLVQNCDEYYSYNSISGLTSAADGPTEKHDPWVLAGRTILKMEERKDVMRSDRFKQVMLELDPSFDEKEIGFSKFNRFLTEAASRGILSLEKAANGQYEVAAGSRAKSTASGDGPNRAADGEVKASPVPEKRSRSRTRSRRSPERRASRTEAPPAEGEAPEVDAGRLRSAYSLLAEVTQELAGPDRPVRDSEVKRRMLDKDGKFDEAALGFRKFSRFLRQAHDEGIVDLERGPEGNYLVSPSGDGAAPPAADRGSARDRPQDQERATGAKPGRSRKPRSERTDRGARPDRGRGRTTAKERAEENRAERRDEPEGRAADSVTAAEPEASPAQDVADGPEAPATQPDTAAPAARQVGMGRFRRGSRSRKPAAPAGAKVVPGPTAEEVGKGESRHAGDDRPPKVEAEASPQADLSSSAPSERSRRSVSGRPRGSGRDRRETEASGTAKEYRSQIEAMSRNYPGVGRRTVEVLFSEFGDRVYEVIDQQPDRIRSVLPDHRARAVLAGREAERATGSGNG